MEKHTIDLTINGEKYELRVAPNELLVNVIRETVGLTGTKYACGTGQWPAVGRAACDNAVTEPPAGR